MTLAATCEDSYMEIGLHPMTEEPPTKSTVLVFYCFPNGQISRRKIHLHPDHLQWRVDEPHSIGWSDLIRFHIVEDV